MGTKSLGNILKRREVRIEQKLPVYNSHWKINLPNNVTETKDFQTNNVSQRKEKSNPCLISCQEQNFPILFLKQQCWRYSKFIPFHQKIHLNSSRCFQDEYFNNKVYAGVRVLADKPVNLGRNSLIKVDLEKKRRDLVHKFNFV